MNQKNVGADSISAHQRGITLIALVVTLVVLLILAGITINFAISEGGIIAKAQSSKEKQEVAVWLDRLTVTEANTAVTNYAVDMEKYNNQLKTEGIVLENNSNYQSEDGGKTYNLTTDNGYVFNISEPTPGDIVINYIGKSGQLKPYIKEIKVISTTTNSSKIEVEVARLEDGKLTYEYKKHAEENYTLLKESKETTADFTGLTQKETYDIKVTAENKNGKSGAKIISIYTGELASGTISQKGTTTWSAGTASIELQTTDTTNTMQYQKNEIVGSWTNYTTAITGLVHEDIVYARMFDGVNGTSPFSVDILDGVAPTVAITNSSSTTNSITVTANSTDAQSGMVASPTYTFYKKVSTEADTSYIKDQEGTNASYTKTGLLQNTTYIIKVETKDKANNIGSLVKNITTEKVTTGIGNITSTVPVWSNGTASITLSTTTGLTIQWQKNAIDSTKWTTGTSITGLNHNDIVYARLTDGTNYGDSASITILDITGPNINSIKKTSISTNSAKLEVNANDIETGIKEYQYYLGINSTNYILQTTSNQTEYTYTELNAENKYYLKVIVTDKAGNQSNSTATLAGSYIYQWNKYNAISNSVGSPYTTPNTTAGINGSGNMTAGTSYSYNETTGLYTIQQVIIRSAMADGGRMQISGGLYIASDGQSSTMMYSPTSCFVHRLGGMFYLWDNSQAGYLSHTNYSTSYSTTYTKGTTYYGQVTSTSSSSYTGTTNGYYGSYWYDYANYKVTWI